MANDVVMDKGRRRFLTATIAVVGGVKALSNCQRDVTQASNDPVLPRLDQQSNICCMSAWPSVDSSPSKRPLA